MAAVFAAKDYNTDNYNKHRPRYPKALYDVIFAYHDSNPDTGRHLAVDLGCGPGMVTEAIAPHFEKVIGVDPSETMLQTARGRGDVPSNVTFEKGTAESLPFLKDASVDIITSGTAAHWFPPEWWNEAKRVVKVGGTVAFWIYAVLTLDPSLPNAQKVNDLWRSARDVYSQSSRPTNAVAHNAYDDIFVPVPGSESGWSEATRRKWDIDGTITDPSGQFFAPYKATIAHMRDEASTYGTVYKWRQEHPDLVGTKDDPTHTLFEKTKELLGIGEYDEFTVGRGFGLVMLTRVE